MDDNITGIVNGGDFPITRYVFTGKLMLTSAVFLFAICVVILFFQTYSRWFSRRRRQQLDNHLRIRRAHHFVFNSEPTAVDISQGLDPSVLKSLPTFFYSAGNTDHRQIECAVCLSKFMEKETCRVLPECNHWFHAECIDMWFQSHSNCPLCRSPVKRVCSAGKAVVSMEESVSCSRFRPTTHGDQSDMGVSFPNESSAGLPVAGDRKQQAAGLVGITVELPTVKDGSEER